MTCESISKKHLNNLMRGLSHVRFDSEENNVMRNKQKG